VRKFTQRNYHDAKLKAEIAKINTRKKREKLAPTPEKISAPQTIGTVAAFHISKIDSTVSDQTFE